MFRRIRKENLQSEESAVEKPSLVKFQRPKILLVDVDHDVAEVLKQAGYNVSLGSLGKLYNVQKVDALVPIIPNGFMPFDYSEHEVVIVDLVVREILSDATGEKAVTPGRADWWTSASGGVIDPRPRQAVDVRSHFDNILSNGGVFIIFAAAKIPQEISLAYVDGPYQLQKLSDIEEDNWSFLSLLKGIKVEQQAGKEIYLEQTFNQLSYLLEPSLDGAHYQCTVKPLLKNLREAWWPVAKNKYSDVVAGTIIKTDKGSPQLVFIFPQLPNKAFFLRAFLSEFLPHLVPKLFPHFEGAKWIHRPEYELTTVKELQGKIQSIQRDANEKIMALEKAIADERIAREFLYKLITATDTELVKAVETALKTLGFQAMINVDEELEKAESAQPKREDLQIHDTSPVVLVEVKGISNLPKDAAALQVWKYIAPRMREWNRTDIKGLSIINHQKNLPALDRENRAPFRDDVITNAEEHQFGLMTTWDLFRLVRNFFRYQWSHEQVKDLFYQNGRIEPIPLHYHYIGAVEHVWPKAGAVGVRVEESAIHLGDRIAFEFSVEFEEQVIESLQVDKEAIAEVISGQLAGIQTSLIEKGLKDGMRVFRVTS